MRFDEKRKQRSEKDGVDFRNCVIMGACSFRSSLVHCFNRVADYIILYKQLIKGICMILQQVIDWPAGVEISSNHRFVEVWMGAKKTTSIVFIREYTNAVTFNKLTYGLTGVLSSTKRLSLSPYVGFMMRRICK